MASAVIAMQLELDTVEQVARLARLELSPGEMAQIRRDLAQILEHVQQLNEIDTDAIEPLAHTGDLLNRFREDEIIPSIPRDDALANAANHDGEFFLVPAVFESAQ